MFKQESNTQPDRKQRIDFMGIFQTPNKNTEPENRSGY